MLSHVFTNLKRLVSLVLYGTLILGYITHEEKSMRGILSISIVTIVSALGLMAASSIGVVNSPGEFRLDGSTVRSNATVFDGDVIETSAARSVINIGDTHFAMSPDSRVTIYKDKVQIEKGSGIVSNSAGYAVQAGPVRITPNSIDATLSISVIGDKRVFASALAGGGTVSSAEGVLIAKLNPGMPLEFEGQQGTAEPNVTVTGILKLGKGADNKDYLTDTVTKVKYLVEGQDVSQYVGKAVTLTGSVGPGSPRDCSCRPGYSFGDNQESWCGGRCTWRGRRASSGGPGRHYRRCLGYRGPCQRLVSRSI